jgi:hypothetical protein
MRLRSVGTCLLLLGLAGGLAAETGAPLLGPAVPGTWQSDGMWQITPRAESVEFLKDARPAHNSMCWMTLTPPLRTGQTIEITYLMEVPYKHVDLFLGKDCGRPDAASPMPDLAEVISLGGQDLAGWQTRRLTVTSTQVPLNTLGFLCWGWTVDRNTWMRVAMIRVLPGDPAREWIVWRVAEPLNEQHIPARCPLQDFFPFGVYFPMEFGANCEHEGLADRWEWYDRALADIKARGMNFTSVTNLGAADLDRLAALHAKHGLRMNPQVGEFSVKHQGEAALKPFLRAVETYRGNPVIAGWAVGEEFTAKEVPLLDLPHEIVRAVDPANTLVTIHNNTEAIRAVSRNSDVRIVFRDIYPFFAEPACGPVTHEQCMNYYEDEIDKAQRELPQGASLWVMPQAQHEFYALNPDKPRQFVFRQPTPAEIVLETWAALAHGAQGIAYYLYPSNAPEKPGEIPQSLGLRTCDGRPTPQLEALTTLARQVVPLGPIIARWQRVRLPAATDHRELRAYLFQGGDDAPYVLVLNHDPAQRVSGRVRLPFAASRIVDLIADARVKTVNQGGATVFTLALPPGGGTILRVKGRLPAATAADAEDRADVPRVSGRPRLDLPLDDLPDGRRLFRYQLDLQKTEGIPPGDSVGGDVAFHDWGKPGATYMNGVFGRDVTFRFDMPGTIARVAGSGCYANHANSVPGTYRILYSLDGKEFKPVAELADALPGNGMEVAGTVAPPAGIRRVWVTYAFPQRNPGIVLKALTVELTVQGEE